MNGRSEAYEKAGKESDLKAGKRFSLSRLLRVLREYRPKRFMKAIPEEEEWECKVDVDVEQMAKKTGISKEIIKDYLGLPMLFGVTTAREAKAAYDAACFIREDEAEAIMEKWEELSLQEIDEATTIEEVKAAYDNAPYNPPFRSEVRIAAVRKLATFFPNKLGKRMGTK